MKEFVKLEAPRLLLIVHEAMIILWDVYIHVLNRKRSFCDKVVTFVVGSMKRFFDAKLAVGRVLITTLTLCLTIFNIIWLLDGREILINFELFLRNYNK